MSGLFRLAIVELGLLIYGLYCLFCCLVVLLFCCRFGCEVVDLGCC